MTLLIQFIFRVSFGLALGMALTSPRQVTSGFYRNHLYVLLGLNVLATLLAVSAPTQVTWGLPLTAAVLCYLGAVSWLYEKPLTGIVLLWLISLLSLAGAWLTMNWPHSAGVLAKMLNLFDPVTAGLLLGLTLSAMFLGHWYLNTPSMALGPLERLILLMAGAVVLRAAVGGGALAGEVAAGNWPATNTWLLIMLRWLAGIAGAGLLAWMAWKTLKIPNTQSATGILYVGVIATFLGELTALLLHAEAIFPL